MRSSLRSFLIFAAVFGLLGGTTLSAIARDKPASTSGVFVGPRTVRAELDAAEAGVSGSKQSKVQIERFRCESSGDPAAAVDISCNDDEFGQSYSPDNEIAVAVDPEDPDHIVAGSNDYFYRFNNSTGARQVIVPTGFFTSFDGGATWIDGQIPMRSGNGAGDPSPAVRRWESCRAHGPARERRWPGWPLRRPGRRLGQPLDRWRRDLERAGHGDEGTGTGIGPANQAVFWDKEWLTVDNNPDSDCTGGRISPPRGS